jgi:hypothetical protein
VVCLLALVVVLGIIVGGVSLLDSLKEAVKN